MILIDLNLINSLVRSEEFNKMCFYKRRYWKSSELFMLLEILDESIVGLDSKNYKILTNV